ncbi:AMP-binding protein [Alicyclobacillus tolerans]|uniref:AMP-binding protein n=1 Tax=Alicyclobacillus tolerans TaxID=90970 RepID=UPI003B78E07E
MMENLFHHSGFLESIKQHVRKFPTKTAVVDISNPQSITMSYQELQETAETIAANLLAKGLQKGEAVAYQLPSGWQFIVITMGIWYAGGVPCPLLPSLREREVRFILERSQARFYIYPDTYRNFDYSQLAHSLEDKFADLQFFCIPQSEQIPALSSLAGLADPLDHEYHLQPHAPTLDSIAQLLFTSGTTGEPKGALHTFSTLSYALFRHTQTLRLSHQDVIWVPSPLAHQTGFLYGMMLSLFLGATGVYHAAWHVEKAKQAIEKEGATFVQAAMPFLSDITHMSEPPQGLRIFVATGAAIPRQLADLAKQKLACKIVGAWGSTETCLVTVGHPDDPVEKLWGTDGRVMEGMSIRVVDENGQVLPPGTEGNFQVKTPAMFIGYLHRPDLYEAALTKDGYFDTGDLAIVDEDGFIKISGRKKDIINRGGEKIPVAEIENLLYTHPSIADAALVAMPDLRLGERACLFVVGKEDSQPLKLEDITGFLQQQGVAKIYWPERLEWIAEMPRTASGKIQKYLLRQRLQEKSLDA